MDEFASLPDDEFSSLPDDNKIEHPENVLQKVAKVAGQVAMPSGGNPFTNLLQGKYSTGMTGAPGMGAYNAMHDIKSDVISKNVENPFMRVLTDLGTDPELFMGGGEVAKKAPEVIGKMAERAPAGFGNVLTKSGRLSYFDNMENAIYSARENASPQFGKALQDISLKNPGKSVDLSEVGANLLNSEDPMVQSILKKSPELQNIATHPTGQIPLPQAQEALNSITTHLPKNVLQGSGKRSMHVPIMDIQDDLRMAMSRDFPEIQDARNAYGQTVNDFRSVRPKLSGDAAAKNLFADYNPFHQTGKEFMGGERSEEAFKNLVGKDTFKEAIQTRHAKMASDAAKTFLVGKLGLDAKKRFFK